MVEICIATLRVSKRPCNRESVLGNLCMIHWLQKEGRLKHSTKDWKDKCKKCGRPRKLFMNDLCIVCKNG
ncbi:MAG: hypothetical protein Q7R52_00390 [archaeon]|nr:hypothetical protein [archaeon]